jgi:hypothetical protein
MSDQKALTPIEQRQVAFYGDEIVAVVVEGDQVFVPIRPICDFLGVDWSAQYRRVTGDPVLSIELQTCVVVTATQGQPDQRRDMICLPLEFISGWLFGINAKRVKEEVRERLVRYQRDCYRVLDEAFRDGRLTAGSDFDELLASNSPTAQAYKMAAAIMRMAQQQLLLESRVDDHDKRIETLEETLGDPGRHITPEQASQISQAVKAVAMKMSEKSGRNEYGGVYGEMYRKFGITGYKLLPASRFQEAMGWLSEWYQQIAGNNDVPF